MEKVAYGVCGLTPDQLWVMTPRDYQALQEARADWINKERQFHDIEMAHLKFAVLRSVGGEVTIDDLRLVSIPEPSEPTKIDDDYFERNRQTLRGVVAATGGNYGS